MAFTICFIKQSVGRVDLQQTRGVGTDGQTDGTTGLRKEDRQATEKTDRNIVRTAHQPFHL